MNILFLHRNFPAQFRHIITELAKDPDNNVVFLTNRMETPEIKGVKKVIYGTKREVPQYAHNYLRFYEDAIIHGQGVAEAAIKLKKQGFVPDVIYGHTWGNTMFMKDIFPDVPLLCYFEWFYNADGADVGFDSNVLNENSRAKTRCKNSHLLVDLYSCDKGLSPTAWQKNQFPKEFHNKIEVMHDGVDTDFFAPNKNVEFKVPNSDLVLTADDEVVTYATRGMEPYRGFPQFMEAASEILKKRPNARIIVAGEDRVCYGAKLPEGQTFKKLMLEKFDYDMSRVHFVGNLPYGEYLKLLQVSSAHVYLTYPFVLSWSLLEAMSVGCCIVASNTQPVLEVIKDNKNGLLVDFYDVNSIVSKIEYAIDNKEQLEEIGMSARQVVVEKYDLKKLLPEHIKLLKSLAK